MNRLYLAVAAFLLGCSNALAADACQEFVKLKTLPDAFKTVSRYALGPATMEIKSDGKCTCNDLPAVQRSLGRAAPEGVNFACDVAEADDTKGK